MADDELFGELPEQTKPHDDAAPRGGPRQVKRGVCRRRRRRPFWHLFQYITCYCSIPTCCSACSCLA